VSRLRRLGAALLAVTLLGGALVACDDLGYEKDWPVGDVLVVVRHKGGLALVGIDPVTGTGHPFAQVPGVHISSALVPEAAVLHTDRGVFIAATQGADPGVLVRVDMSAHKLVKVADLPSARLPIADSRTLRTVGGTDGSFQSHQFVLDGAAAAQPHPLALTPISSDGHCLTGTTGSAESVHIGLIGTQDQPTAPRDLGPGVPGGVACAGDLALVTVSSLNAAGQQPPPGTTMLAVGGGGEVRRITVARQPHQVAVDEKGSVAAVAVSGDTGPAVQRVDLGTGRVVATTALPGGLQVESMVIRGGNIFVIGGNQGVVLPAAGDRATTINLPGENATSVWD
jgi:hypothetical protein